MTTLCLPSCFTTIQYGGLRVNSSGLGILASSGITSGPVSFAPGGACFWRDGTTVWLSGDPRSRSAQSSASSGASMLVPAGSSSSVAPNIGEGAKSLRRSEVKPARTVLSCGIFPLGSAMTNMDLFASHAVTGRVDFPETCNLY